MPTHEDKESAAHVLAHLIDEAKAIGHAHAAPEDRAATWGGSFVDSLKSAWNIVNKFSGAIKGWIDAQNEGLFTPEAFQQAVNQEAELVAGTETQAAVEQAVVDELAAQGFAQVVWLAQEGACDMCHENMAAGPISIGDSFPNGSSTPPAHPRCRCSIGSPGDEDYYKPAWALTRAGEDNK